MSWLFNSHTDFTDLADFLCPAEIAEIAEILFLVDRAALSCFRHRLGLLLIVS